MSSTVLLFSADPAFADHFQHPELADYPLEFHITTDVEFVWTELKRRSTPPHLILDLRGPELSAETLDLLQRLSSGELEYLNLIPVTSGKYPIDFAAQLDLFALNVISNINDAEQLRTALELLCTAPYSRSGRKLPERHTLAAGSSVFHTYTPELASVLQQLRRVATHDVTLLLVGETGTGKTTLATLIHQLSPRSERAFHHLACGALPPDLIESELFGHARGAFTGADRTKIGRFEAAGSGTLLLDEIDVLGKKEQAKLLKVIELGEYEMVGSTEPKTSKARLIVAANVDLECLTQRGDFRSDLYYRLSVLEFHLPPLRRRPRDLGLLAVQFAREIGEKNGITVDWIHHDFLEALKAYHWPGNLRELKNHIRRAVLFCEDAQLTVNDLSHSIINAQFSAPVSDSATEEPWTLADRVAENERRILEEALAGHGYNKTATAKSLGISRVGLYKKMKKYGMIEDQPVTTGYTN